MGGRNTRKGIYGHVFTTNPGVSFLESSLVVSLASKVEGEMVSCMREQKKRYGVAVVTHLLKERRERERDRWASRTRERRSGFHVRSSFTRPAWSCLQRWLRVVLPRHNMQQRIPASWLPSCVLRSFLSAQQMYMRHVSRSFRKLPQFVLGPCN